MRPSVAVVPEIQAEIKCVAEAVVERFELELAAVEGALVSWIGSGRASREQQRLYHLSKAVWYRYCWCWIQTSFGIARSGTEAR